MKALQVQPASIVVGIDDTREATAALDWAIAQAHLTHGSLTLVHAIGNKVAAWVNTETADIIPLGPISRAGQDLLDRMCAHVDARDPAIPVATMLRHTGPLSALTAAATGARGLVVGVHHRYAHRTSVLDPIGQLLRHGAHCPIVEVGPIGAGTGQRMLVVVDGTARACHLLAFAFARAAMTSLPLVVVLLPIGALPGHLLDDSAPDVEGGKLIRLVCDRYASRFPQLHYQVHSRPAEVVEALCGGRLAFREMILDEHHVPLVDEELYGGRSPVDAVEATTVLPDPHEDRVGSHVDPHGPLTQDQVDRLVEALMRDLDRPEWSAPLLGQPAVDERALVLEPARVVRRHRFGHGS